MEYGVVLKNTLIIDCIYALLETYFEYILCILSSILPASTDMTEERVDLLFTESGL